MTEIFLVPGSVSLETWRAIYRGATARLHHDAWVAIETGHDALRSILAHGVPIYGINTGFGRLASIRIDDDKLSVLQRNIVLSHAAGVGDALARPICRLMMALKLTSLARGASGVRPATLALLERMLAADILPVIPSQGSVGASGDLAPLAHLAAAMIGEGSVDWIGVRQDAGAALRASGLAPVELGPKEGLALLNGTQFSTANALAALFEAERLIQNALITGALSTDAAKGSDGPFDARIHSLRGHNGQIDAAASLRLLMEESPIRASHLLGDDRVQDPYCLRCQPQVIGAVLDLLRQAANTLAVEANGVTDNPLIMADTLEAISGGNFHAEPVAFAADMIALGLCEVGSIAERRVALLVDPSMSRLPAFLTSRPGLNSGFMIAQVTAAALVSENKQRATPTSIDSIPTSANQEDHVSMAAHGARRLLPMASNLAAILGIELLAAAQGCDFHAPLKTSSTLERVKARVRASVAHLEEDRFMSPDLESAAELVRSGALLEAVAPLPLPGVIRCSRRADVA